MEAWRPADFGVYLQRTGTWGREVGAPYHRELGYNEILVDGDWWTAHLPDAVEAFFHGGESALAREQHRRFLQEFGLTADQVPLVRLDRRNWEAPFAWHG